MLLTLSDDDAMIVRQASEIMKRHLISDRTVLSSPMDTREYLQLQIAHLEHEVFGVILAASRSW